LVVDPCLNPIVHGRAMVMVEMDLEPRKAVNMAEEKKRKIKNVTIAVKFIIAGFIAFIVFTTSTIQWKFFTSYTLFCMASPLCVTLFSTSVTYKVWALSLDPHFICNRCGEQGHTKRRCHTKECIRCKEFPLNCRCCENDESDETSYDGRCHYDDPSYEFYTL
jgi:hypothetical protein